LPALASSQPKPEHGRGTTRGFVLSNEPEVGASLLSLCDYRHESEDKGESRPKSTLAQAVSQPIGPFTERDALPGLLRAHVHLDVLVVRAGPWQSESALD